MTEPDEVDEPGWRIRFGAGLLVHAPLGDAQRLAQEREDERERKAAEFEDQQRREAAIERRWHLQQQGVTPMSHEAILQASAVAQDRQDRRDKKRDEDAAAVLGAPVPGLNRWELKRGVEEREAAKETTPATQAELGRLEQAVTQLKSKLHSLSGRRSESVPPQQGYRSSGYHEPRPYVRTTGGPIVRGPY